VEVEIIRRNEWKIRNRKIVLDFHSSLRKMDGKFCVKSVKILLDFHYFYLLNTRGTSISLLKEGLLQRLVSLGYPELLSIKS